MRKTTQTSADIAEQPPDTWLYCMHCLRFFHSERLRLDAKAEVRKRCPFCPAEGLGCDILEWQPYQRRRRRRRRSGEPDLMVAPP